MTEEIRHPTEAQREAADPARSVWVGANAGSGKTGVLTDRVARLLLTGVAPARILCLTYTKAAAAEMQGRLFKLLGTWAMAEDGDLAERLRAITGEAVPLDRLAAARRLFAQALETPGGLKIQTIHAFCTALLRRFPLEAGLSPRFEEVDDRQAALILARIRAEMAEAAEAGHDPAFDFAAAKLNEDAVDQLVSAVLAKREHFGQDKLGTRLRAVFGAAAEQSPAEAALQALRRFNWPDVRRLAETMLRVGGSNEKKYAPALREAAETWQSTPLTALEGLSGALLTGTGTLRKQGFPTKATVAALPDAQAILDDIGAALLAARDARRAAEAAARARDLDRFATALLHRYEAEKAARGLLDFHDQIARAEQLVTRTDMAAWVLYKMDQGLDHVLVDEAQDTSPQQWRVIEAISAEFHSGATARSGPDVPKRRTMFVVGDEKQSIYSFQGAEPRAFADMGARFEKRLEEAQLGLARPKLDVSFRSAQGILDFVDRVFSLPDGAGLAAAGTTHKAKRQGDGARVDIWPLVAPVPKEANADWWAPVDAVPPTHPRLRLAEHLADEIAGMVRGARLPDRRKARGRRVRPGDILVLVRRRDMLAQHLIRALKNRGVPVAGADRLTLTGELAVKDLIALLKCLVTPADDLSLAAVLRSPLCEMSEEDLFLRAHDRPGTLWQAVAASGGREAEMLADLAARADFLRPYELLERVLIRHDGRRRLVARLGREAEDPLDELLAQALAYEATEPPTLAGFIAWVEAADVEVKREMDRGEDQVRVMTVHGAKGLEAPVVILPDTLTKPDRTRAGPLLLPASEDEDAPLLWLGRAKADDPVSAAARERAKAREREEHLRLLYVALTRAEDWLILCGAGDAGRAGETWYALLSEAMATMAYQEISTAAGQAQRFEVVASPTPEAAEAAAEARPPEEAPPPPAWLSPAPREARAAVPAPSRLLPDAPMPMSTAMPADAEAARRHGVAVHLLLEKLPAVAPEARTDAAERLLAQTGLEPAEIARAAAEAEAVLAAPFAAHVFGPESLGEAGLSLRLPAIHPAPMLGRIDRLIVGPGRVEVIDIKSDAAPPSRPEEIAPAYLAQIGAYAAALGDIYPGREITAAFLWTRGPGLMQVPMALCQAALARAAP